MEGVVEVVVLLDKSHREGEIASSKRMSDDKVLVLEGSVIVGSENRSAKELACTLS